LRKTKMQVRETRIIARDENTVEGESIESERDRETHESPRCKRERRKYRERQRCGREIRCEKERKEMRRESEDRSKRERERGKESDRESARVRA